MVVSSSISTSRPFPVSSLPKGAWKDLLERLPRNLPPERTTLRVPAIPRCPLLYDYDYGNGYCLKFKNDDSIEPLCMPCASEDQRLEGSTCYGRAYRGKELFCDDDADDHTHGYILNDDGLCVKFQAYRPFGKCADGFRKSKIRDERVCRREEIFEPELSCEGFAEKVDIHTGDCLVEIRQQILIDPITPTAETAPERNTQGGETATATASSLSPLSCPPGFFLRSPDPRVKPRPQAAAFAEINFDSPGPPSPQQNPNQPQGGQREGDGGTIRELPHDGSTAVCVALVPSGRRATKLCPRDSIALKSGKCRRILISSRYYPDLCMDGWFFNDRLGLCERARIKKPQRLCPRKWKEWPSDDPEKQCFTEKAQKADCVCPPGTIQKPAPERYPGLAEAREREKCVMVRLKAPIWSCAHVPGYALDPVAKQCTQPVLPEQVRAPRKGMSLVLLDYAIGRVVRRLNRAARLQAWWERRIVRVKLPPETEREVNDWRKKKNQAKAVEAFTGPGYSPLPDCSLVAGDRNPDSLPVACHPVIRPEGETGPGIRQGEAGPPPSGPPGAPPSGSTLATQRPASASPAESERVPGPQEGEGGGAAAENGPEIVENRGQEEEGLNEEVEEEAGKPIEETTGKERFGGPDPQRQKEGKREEKEEEKAIGQTENPDPQPFNESGVSDTTVVTDTDRKRTAPSEEEDSRLFDATKKDVGESAASPAEGGDIHIEVPPHQSENASEENLFDFEGDLPVVEKRSNASSVDPFVSPPSPLPPSSSSSSSFVHVLGDGSEERRAHLESLVPFLEAEEAETGEEEEKEGEAEGKGVEEAFHPQSPLSLSGGGVSLSAAAFWRLFASAENGGKEEEEDRDSEEEMSDSEFEREYLREDAQDRQFTSGPGMVVVTVAGQLKDGDREEDKEKDYDDEDEYEDFVIKSELPAHFRRLWERRKVDQWTDVTEQAKKEMDAKGWARRLWQTMSQLGSNV